MKCGWMCDGLWVALAVAFSKKGNRPPEQITTGHFALHRPPLLLALRNTVPENGVRILLKLEAENPTGSMKDRMVL
jgi:hypothetical protein